jgi:sec-independent protein translocase protein TatC
MAKKEGKDMSFLDHLEVLRWHIIRSVAVVFILAVTAFFFHAFIFDQIILAPKNASFITNRLFCELGEHLHKPSLCINSKPFQIINISMAGQFNMHMVSSMVAGLILGFPYVFWEIWSFIQPALQTNERKYARWAVAATSILFMIGILFGYYLITPLSVDFLGSYSVSDQVTNQIQLTSYISTILSVTLASGLVFELPIVVYFFSKIGLLSPRFMRKYRRHAIVIILIIAAIITPPDVFSQILVTIPLLTLYELSILISAYVVRKQSK